MEQFDDIFLLIAAIPLLLIVAFVLQIVGRRSEERRDARKKTLLARYPRQHVFLCYGIDDLGDGLVQFLGQSHGGDVRPGMHLTVPIGGRYRIEEVYNSDETNDPMLDKPDSVLPEGQDGTVVIKAPHFNRTSFYQQKKRDGYAVWMIAD